MNNKLFKIIIFKNKVMEINFYPLNLEREILLQNFHISNVLYTMLNQVIIMLI